MEKYTKIVVSECMYNIHTNILSRLATVLRPTLDQEHLCVFLIPREGAEGKIGSACPLLNETVMLDPLCIPMQLFSTLDHLFSFHLLFLGLERHQTS